MALPVTKEDREGCLPSLLSRDSPSPRFSSCFRDFSSWISLMPDMIPFLDEMFLGALTVLFGMWRDRKAARPGSGT